MLTVEQIEAIRRAYYHEHKSVRAIAREQQHGRRVVREAIAGERPQPRRYRLTRRKARPVLDPVVAIIDAWLAADATAPRKQRHTAKRVYDRLVAEHDFVDHDRLSGTRLSYHSHDVVVVESAATIPVAPSRPAARAGGGTRVGYEGNHPGQAAGSGG